MDKIMEKTSIKSRIDEAVKEANERKAESKTIEEVTGTEKNIDKIKAVGKEAAYTESFDFPEINESVVEEIKPYDDIEGATIDVNRMTHPQEVEEIKFRELVMMLMSWNQIQVIKLKLRRKML